MNHLIALFKPGNMKSYTLVSKCCKAPLLKETNLLIGYCSNCLDKCAYISLLGKTIERQTGKFEDTEYNFISKFI